MAETAWRGVPQQVAGRCCVPAHPDLKARMQARLDELAGSLGSDQLLPMAKLEAPERRSPGLNDGLIIPGRYYPLGTSVDRVRTAALDRAPLRGTLRVIVVLVDFEDQPMEKQAGHFRDLFFSTGVLPKGSVREYFTEASGGAITIAGEVVGPYRMPQKLAEYANGESGTGPAAPNARTLARHAAEASDADVEFGPYDNDNNGFVDAFIVVHAGPGGEVTGNGGHIWSHKWVLSGGEYPADSTKIYAYLTVPEDARIGVCAHELGHLLFGWPDLYDIDGSSEGIGNWCLMAGGSWNDGGDVPAHPSAWCKVNQGWVSVVNQTANGPVNVADVKDARTVYRLWKDGAPSQEYFLLENRQKARFDAHLPGAGLLIWHVDEAIATNGDEAHYRVALVQADGRGDLEKAANRGDDGDCYPGSANNVAFTSTSTPNSRSYGGLDTAVSVSGITASAPVMTVNVAVAPKAKEGKDSPEKGAEAAVAGAGKPAGAWGEAGWWAAGGPYGKPMEKQAEKPPEGYGPPGGWPPGPTFLWPPAVRMRAGPSGGRAARVAALEARVAALEAALAASGSGAPPAPPFASSPAPPAGPAAAAGAQPFIDQSQRPEPGGSALDAVSEALNRRMAAGDAEAKRYYDSKPPEG